jgi:hypothetical protein
MMWVIGFIAVAIGSWTAVTSGKEVKRGWRVAYVALFVCFMVSVILGAYIHTGPYAVGCAIADFCLVAIMATIAVTQRSVDPNRDDPG